MGYIDVWMDLFVFIYICLNKQKKPSDICFIWCLTKYYPIFFKEVTLNSCLRNI